MILRGAAPIKISADPVNLAPDCRGRDAEAGPEAGGKARWAVIADIERHPVHRMSCGLHQPQRTGDAQIREEVREPCAFSCQAPSQRSLAHRKSSRRLWSRPGRGGIFSQKDSEARSEAGRRCPGK